MISQPSPHVRVAAAKIEAMRKKIRKIVNEAAENPDKAQRRKIIKQLRLRWHPDKHVKDHDFATQVSQFISQSVAKKKDA